MDRRVIALLDRIAHELPESARPIVDGVRLALEEEERSARTLEKEAASLEKALLYAANLPEGQEAASNLRQRRRESEAGAAPVTVEQLHEALFLMIRQREDNAQWMERAGKRLVELGRLSREDFWGDITNLLRNAHRREEEPTDLLITLDEVAGVIGRSGCAFLRKRDARKGRRS